MLNGYKDGYFDGLFSEEGFNGIKAVKEGKTITFSSTSGAGKYPNNIKIRLVVMQFKV